MFNQSKIIVISLLSVQSLLGNAAGTFCSLSPNPTGSAYINFYNEGRVVPPLAGPPVTPLQSRTNFGVDLPYGGSAGSCQISGMANYASAPLPGYGIQVTSNSQNVYATDGVTVIGSVNERIWRKASSSPPMCILGTAVYLTSNAYYNGSQYFELNDIARGGFSNSGSVNVGYFALPTTPAMFPVYRAGRTFTSVQHRAYKYDGFQSEKQNNGIGYLDLPTINGSSTLSINGVNSPISGFSIATTGGNTALQDAQVNSNWVDFTLHAIYTDGRITDPVSSMTYIEFPCNNDSAAVINATWRKAGALRLRQTGQKNTTFHEISLYGYAPPGATLP